VASADKSLSLMLTYSSNQRKWRVAHSPLIASILEIGRQFMKFGKRSAGSLSWLFLVEELESLVLGPNLIIHKLGNIF